MKNYFNITFEKNGLCIAYLTPDTLREIVSWVIQIYSLEQPVGKNKSKGYEANIKYFWEEIFHSLCKKYLPVEKQDIFEMLEMLEPKQQVNSIIRELRIMILKHLESIGKKEENSNNVLNREFFYLLSYVFKTDKQSQAFVVMCLIYFTIKLTQLKIELELSRTDELRKNISKRILCYYSVGRWGILGTWEEKILPSISIIDKEDSDYKKIAAEISSEQAFLEFKLHNILTYTEYENEKGKYIGELKNIQYILLFYKIHVLNTDNNLWKLKENSQNELRLNKDYKGTFSVLGFVLNMLTGTQIVENFVNSVCDILVSKDNEDSNREKIKEEISIIPELEKYSNKLLLPINDMEFVKYLGETLKVEIKKKSYVRDIKSIFVDCFNIVQRCLDDYFKDGTTDYSTRFFEFPLVKKIVGQEEGFLELLEKTISKHLKEDDFLDDEEWDMGV